MLKQLLVIALAVLANGESVTGCHRHGSTLFCIDTNGNEGYVTPNPSGAIMPKSLTSCTSEGDNYLCSTGANVYTFRAEADAEAHETGASSASASSVSGSSGTITSAAASATANDITNCHFHGTVQFCVDVNGNEGSVSPAPTNTGDAPKSYTKCHAHGATATFCMNGDEEVQFMAEAEGSHAEETAATSSGPQAEVTAVTGCHFHGATQFCVDNNGAEGYMTPAPSNTANAPASYTSCHAHATETFCMDADGNEVQYRVEAVESSPNSTDEMDCHFHAGVEHCIPKGGSEHSGETAPVCERQDRDYNIPLRIGTIFAVLATSLIASFIPIFVKKFFNTAMNGLLFMTLKQFGTGVIISTALVHLLTHASLMFNNKCLTGVKYEATTTAIVMAGLFISFTVEYITNRLLLARQMRLDKLESAKTGSDEDLKASSDDQVIVHRDHHDVISHKKDGVSVWLLEAGIIFHSILVGVTLVVAGDSYYITLFIVIIFHQCFEGIALAARIADLTIALWQKLAMAVAFAITTPIGMAIGTGVISTFNGNDPSTIIAIGTLDAFSAGILLWVGLIEMWSHDWLHGTLADASITMVLFGFFGLIAGMVLMSFLGKWA